jgi:competence protein ComGC
MIPMRDNAYNKLLLSDQTFSATNTGMDQPSEAVVLTNLDKTISLVRMVNARTSFQTNATAKVEFNLAKTIVSVANHAELELDLTLTPITVLTMLLFRHVVATKNTILQHNNANHVKMVNSQETLTVDNKDLDAEADKSQLPNPATTKTCTDLVNSTATHACNAEQDKD